MADRGELGAALLATLPRTEIRSAEEYEDLTARRARAAGYGALQYRLREPPQARAVHPCAFTTIGNCVLGGMEFSVVEDRLGTEITFTGAVPMIGLSAVLHGGMHLLPFGQAPATAQPGEMLLIEPNPAERVLTADGTVRMNLWLKAGTIAQHLETRLGCSLSTPLTFAPVEDWPPGQGAALARLVHYVAAELADPHSSFARGVGVEAFSEMVAVQLLHGVPHNYSALLRQGAQSAPVRSVRRAEAFMRANLSLPILVDDVARAAGCSPRTLTGAFRRSAGRTIMAALRDWRLDAARTEFIRGDPAASVAAVAARFGFSNPSRFAAYYRARFGEAPRRTRPGE